MAELYFIKLNPVIARINLYNAICRNPETMLPFLPKDQNANLEHIKLKVKENIDDLRAEELSWIFAWARALSNANKEDLQTRLFINGIDIFYEITDHTAADQLINMFSEYQEISGVHFDVHMKPDQFSHFLIYGIFFTGMVQHDEHNEVFHYLKKEFENLYTIAEKQYHLHQQTEPGKDFSALKAHLMALYDYIRFSKDNIILLKYSDSSIK